ncbi:MAG: hypothetical protein V4459_06480 [Pseudomonadota bacterium]
MDTILGLSVPAFTLLHVIISLIGIAAGLLLFLGWVQGRWSDLWNRIFLVFTILTSVTGFFFHSKAFGPPHVVGVISLIVLAVSLIALYGYNRTGIWRPTYAITAAIAQWFNIFVLITQLFQKVPALASLPPVAGLVAQGAGLLLMVWLGWRAVKSRA